METILYSIEITLILTKINPHENSHQSHYGILFQVLISDNGVLQLQKVVKTVTESFWIGPSLVS